VATQRVETTHWPPRFNGPPEALAGWRAAGIDVVTLANNHAYDQRREGLAETIAAARAAGLRTAGAGDAAEARAPVALSERAPRVLLLDYLWTPERMPDPPDETAARIAVLDDRTAAEVRAAADDSDVLLVVVHWIGEFQARPIDAWREWTRRIAGSGADAIVCHGPHVVGPLETIDAGGRAVPVAFSLGNLVANMGWGVHPGVELPPSSDSEFRIETREEALAVLRIDPPAPGAGTGAAWAVGGLWIVPLWLEDNRPLAGGPHGPRREIFPRPMPWCAAPPETGCFEGASDAWCAGRREMIAERRDALLRTIWNAPPQPLPPCPAGADPYDPPPDFRTFGLAGAGGGP
jgi:hypothetical protein